MSSYCSLAPTHPVHGPYHDKEYGFPVREDDVLFERLALEINQAGLSWETVLRKRAAFRTAFRRFEIARVARFGERDAARLMANPGIIRNRLKIESVVANARTVRALQKSHGSFAGWLDAHHPLPLDAWVKLFRRTFRFTGGEITREFLVSTGYLPGAHDRRCPIYGRIEKTRPPWMNA